jgi:CheY-like chemotaxis protein
MKNGKKYILVADDEREIREVLTLLLTGEGYEVVCAENGLSAAQAACAEIDLYILDVNMPGQNGFMTGADIRRRFAEGGSLADALSGSASAVFGLFEDEATATACAERLRKRYPETYVCRPCNGLIVEKFA